MTRAPAAAEGRAARFWDRWRLGWLLLAALFVAPVGYAGPLGFVPLVGIAALALLPAVRFRSSPWPFLILLALLIWALVTWTWSPVEPDWTGSRVWVDLGGSVALKLAALLPLCAAFVIAADRLRTTSARIVSVALAGAVVVLAAVLLIEGATGGALYRQIQPDMREDLAFRNAGRGVFVAAVLFWPAAGVLTRRFGKGSALALATGLAIAAAAVLLDMTAGALAVIAGGVVFAIFHAAPRFAGWLAAAFVTAFTLSAPWLALAAPPAGGQPASWAARLDIWREMAERAVQRPVTGWGLDASRTFDISLHPHNAALQSWVELGLPGALLFALFWSAAFLACARVGREDPTVGAAWAGGATAFFVIGGLSFGMWQEWWLALGAACFATALTLRRGWSAPALSTDGGRRAGGDTLRPL